MAGAVDGPHVLQLEVPHQVGLHERGEHAARRAVDVDADRQLRMLLVVRFHQLVELLHVVELAGVGDAEDGRNADGVVVHVVHDRVHVQRQMVLLKRHEVHLDVPIAAELLPAHLVACGDHQVRALLGVDVDAGVLRQLLPAEQHAAAAQHAGRGRADGGRAHGLLGRVGMPQIADHGDAAVLEVGRHGVLVLVDGVLLHRLGHDLRGHGLHVGLAERGEVLRGVALDGQVLLDHLVGDARLDRLVVHLEARHGHIGCLGAEDGRRVLGAFVHAIEDLAGRCLFLHENLLFRSVIPTLSPRATERACWCRRPSRAAGRAYPGRRGERPRPPPPR